MQRQDAKSDFRASLAIVSLLLLTGCPNKSQPARLAIRVDGGAVDPVMQQPLHSEIRLYEFGEPHKTDVGTSFAAARQIRGGSAIYSIRFRDSQRFVDVPESEAQGLLALYKQLHGKRMPNTKGLQKSLVLWQFGSWWVRYQLDDRRWQQGAPPKSALLQVEIKSPQTYFSALALALKDAQELRKVEPSVSISGN